MLSTHSARTLVHDGLVYLPVSSSLVEDAAAASKTVIAALLQQQERSMLVRPGESAADFGLPPFSLYCSADIQRNGYVFARTGRKGCYASSDFLSRG